ncbi:MAG: 4Fe-4S ferredoxin [Deltaproteobacteria bacterium HGW-Deltaproteobacteria-18]|nr:MAG: 4Fe-4S ferredoxin [Deltaproteobacteria bacterium HGW-Deltaproteobacteria-18]
MYRFGAQCIVFSPTGTTRQVLESITLGLAPEFRSQLELTHPVLKQVPGEYQGEDAGVALIGMPVHAGRIPALAVTRLRASVRGNGRKAVLVVVYGNRAYDDALLELRDLAMELGFVPFAAAAFVGEHSFSTSDFAVAQGRPDKMDLDKALEFGESVRKKMIEVREDWGNERLLHVPGNFPYREGVQPALISPETDALKCVLCGDCVEPCPTSAISLKGDTVDTDKMSCLRCCACIRACPSGARVMLHPKILEFGRTLHEKFAIRREPELFV